MSTRPGLTIAAILLAAGESTRMGSSKPLLPWQGTTLVVWQARQLLEGGADLVVAVTGYRAGDVEAEVNRVFGRDAGRLDEPPSQVTAVHNPDYALGKTTSIRKGLAALPPDTRTVLLLAVDQPRPASVMARVLECHKRTGAPISSPRYANHGGHPLVFDAALLAELRAISEEREGLREVMRRHSHEINWVPFNTPVVRLDLNTPEAYREAQRLFDGRGQADGSLHTDDTGR